MFTLQLLHANDFEGGARDAFNRADEFAAVWDALDQTQTNTLKLSSGDAVLAGPMFNAGGVDDAALNGTLADVSESILGLEDGALAGFETDSGRPDITLLNLLGMDAVTVGNHEFDAGTGGFEDFIRPDGGDGSLETAEWLGTFFPYLSTNLDVSGEGDLADLFHDIETDGIRASESFTPDPADDFDAAVNDDKLTQATTVDVNGETVGVVGATTQVLESIASTGGVDVDGPEQDDMEALAALIQSDVDALSGQGVDKIVVQTHLQQFALEQELAPLLADVDILMAGGSNAISANDFDREAGQPNSSTDLNAGDSADAPYAQIIDGANGSPTALISTDGNWEYVGNLVVTFDDNGVLDPDSIDPTVSGPFAATQATVEELYDTPADAFAEGTVGGQARDIVDAVDAIVEQQDGVVPGITNVALDGQRASVRTEETNLGNLTADANLWYAQQADDTVTVSLKNGGGIRAEIAEQQNNPDGTVSLVAPAGDAEIGKPEGGVSQLAIGGSLAFNNGLTLITLTPDQLLQTLEHSVAATDPGATPGQFAQVGGITFAFDPTQPADSRVTDVNLLNEDGTTGQAIVADGQVADDAPSAIRLVTLSFLADGGDGYPFQDFVAADSDFANRVDLEGGDIAAPDNFTFAAEGTEQDALAEFLDQFHGEAGSAFNAAETSPIADERIQNAWVDQVSELFAGYLGRAPSASELQTQFDALAGGASIVEVAQSIATNADAPAFLASPASDAASVGSFVDTIFQNAFNRAPDNEGRDFWIGEIQSRIAEGESLDTVPQDIISGAQNTSFGNDIAVIENRGEAASTFAGALSAAGQTLTGDNAEDAVNILNAITEDARSVEVAESRVDLVTQAPTDFQATQVGRFESGVFAEGAAEIVAHDPATQRLFVTNGNADRMDVLDISDAANPTVIDSVVPTDVLAEAGGFNHIEVNDGVVAIATENESDTGNGRVVFLDSDTLETLNVVEVGVLPDNLQFSDDGNTVVTANEGEQVDEDEDGTPEADPKGSVSIVDISNGVANATVETVGFTQFDGGEDSLREQGVRIFPDRSASDDLEPEYVAFSADGTEARIALQENNAFATVDLVNNQITGLQALGEKDFATSGNGLDAINDGVIDIENLPVKGLYQPDQIAAFDQGGETFYVSANEGDDRDFDVVEAGDADLDPTAAAQVEQYGLDELEISNIDGDTDGDGDIDELVSFGARSFAIWDDGGNLVFDSGSEFEEIMAHEIPNGFNSDDEENDKDSESDEAGPEVEGITVGEIDGTMHAFIGLEKPGGVMVYDISTPSEARFVEYINNRDFDVSLTDADGNPNAAAGDSGPEGLEFIAAEDSPTGNAALVVGNEISGTVTFWDFA